MHTESSAVLFLHQLLHLARQLDHHLERLTLLKFIWYVLHRLLQNFVNQRYDKYETTFELSLLDFKTSLCCWNVCSGTFVTYWCNSVVTASIWKNLDSFPTKRHRPVLFPESCQDAWRLIMQVSLNVLMAFCISLCTTAYLLIKIHHSTHCISEIHQGAISKTPGPKRLPTGTSSPCQRERTLGRDLVKISVLLYVSLYVQTSYFYLLFHFELRSNPSHPPPSTLSPYRRLQCPGEP